MTDQEKLQRLELDTAIMRYRSFIAKNIWHNPRGSDFNDHYKVLARGFASNGFEGISQVIREAAADQQRLIPPGFTIDQYLQLAAKYVAENNFEIAKTVYFLIRQIDPTNVEATEGLSVVAMAIGLQDLAAKMKEQAQSLREQRPK
jgi:hypothetical protein